MQWHDIFISYSREDRSAAHRIASLLENEGFTVWWDAAIHSGEAFDEIIEKQLRAAKAAVVLWSPRSVSSRWVRAEATLADRRNIFVPIIIEPCDLPILFELSHSNDLSTWNGDRSAPVWQRLIGDIHHLVNPVGQSPAPPPVRSRGFLLDDDLPSSDPAPQPAPSRSQDTYAPQSRERGAFAADPETEQTAFYTKSDADLHLSNGKIHCLEVGPADAPIERHPIGILGANLGRAAPADIIFSDKRISRRHCSVEIRNGEMLVTDLQSTNGTFVNGEKIDSPTILPPDSELRLGDIVLTHRVRIPAELS